MKFVLSNHSKSGDFRQKSKVSKEQGDSIQNQDSPGQFRRSGHFTDTSKRLLNAGKPANLLH